MASLLPLLQALLLLLLLSSCHLLAARKTKRQGKVRSVLRECEDNAVEGEDCDFLRSHRALWKELNSMRHQIRKLKEPPKPDNQILVEQMRLNLLQLQITVTRNTEHILTLDKNITSLQGEDERFRASLRHLKEVDNMETLQQVEQLREEKEDLRRNLESLVETVEERLQVQIDRLNDVDQALVTRVSVIESENLTQIHTKIDSLIQDNKDLKDHVRKKFQHHQKYTDSELQILQESLNNTLDVVQYNEKVQSQVNIKLEDDVRALYGSHLNLSMDINGVEQHMREQVQQTNQRIDSTVTDLNVFNNTVNQMDQQNILQHSHIYHSLSVLQNKTTVTDDNIGQIEQTIASQHQHIQGRIQNLTLCHEQLNSSFFDFQVTQDLMFRATNAEVDSLRFGKEYVNFTLREIMETHRLEYNQTLFDLQQLREDNALQSQSLAQFKESEYTERQLILECINGLKDNDTEIHSEIAQIRSTEQSERNVTRRTIQTLQEADAEIHSSLDVINTRLSGPFMMFTSYPSTQYLEYDTSDKLVFDRTILNHGGHYNPDGGWFECPVHGIYQCYLSVWSDFDQRAQVELLVDKTVIMKAAAQPVAEARQHGSNLAVFECHRGQRVWMRGGTFGVLFTDEYRQNSFTGILIHNLEHFQEYSTSGSQ